MWFANHWMSVLLHWGKTPLRKAFPTSFPVDVKEMRAEATGFCHSNIKCEWATFTFIEKKTSPEIKTFINCAYLKKTTVFQTSHSQFKMRNKTVHRIYCSLSEFMGLMSLSVACLISRKSCKDGHTRDINIVLRCLQTAHLATPDLRFKLAM